VLDQDINKYENYLINELLKLRKKIIIVLNKCDLRSRDENNLIKENINLSIFLAHDVLALMNFNNYIIKKTN